MSDVDFKHFGKIIQTFKIFEAKSDLPFMLLTTCTSYCPRRAVEQRGFWFHAQTDWFTCPDFSRAFGSGSDPYTEGVRPQPPSWANYFKVVQFFYQNWVYTPNFGPNIRIFLRFAPTCVKYVKFAPRFSKVRILALSLTIKMSLQRLAYTRALQREKSVSPLFDWCINYPFTWSTSSPLINEHHTWQLYQICLFVRD